MALDSNSRSPNGFLSALAADDFELIRPHLRSADLAQESVLTAAGETLKRAYFPHRGVISLVVNLAKGDHVQVAMIGRDSVLGSFAALGDTTALNSAVVLVPGVASTIDIDRLRAAADQSATLRSQLVRHGVAGRQHPAAGQLHPIQPRAYRDHQPRRSHQDRLRMLRIGQGAVRSAASAPLPRRGSAARTRRVVIQVAIVRPGAVEVSP